MKCPFSGCFSKFFKDSLDDVSENLSNQIIKLTKEVKKMGVQLDALQAGMVELIANVQAEGNVITAAVIAIDGLTAQQAILNQQLQDAIAANNPVAIQEAADAIAAQNTAIIAQTAALAAAIPAAPAV